MAGEKRAAERAAAEAALEQAKAEGKSKWEMLKIQAAEAKAAAEAELQERAQRALATREAELHSSHTRALNDASTAASDELHALRGALEGELAAAKEEAARLGSALAASQDESAALREALARAEEEAGEARRRASELQAQLADEMLKLQEAAAAELARAREQEVPRVRRRCPRWSQLRCGARLQSRTSSLRAVDATPLRRGCAR